MAKQIPSLLQLKRLAKDPLDVFILLRGGARSSKTIQYYPEECIFEIHNDIDDTDQICTEKQLKKETNIITALENGALYTY